MTRFVLAVAAAALALGAGRAEDVTVKANAKDTVTVQGLKFAGEVRRSDDDNGGNPQGVVTTIVIVENVGTQPVKVQGWYFDKKEIETYVGKKINNTGVALPDNTKADGLMLVAARGDKARDCKPWVRAIAAKAAKATASEYTLQPGTSCKVLIDFQPVKADKYNLTLPGDGFGLKDTTVKMPFTDRDIEDKRTKR